MTTQFRWARTPLLNLTALLLGLGVFMAPAVQAAGTVGMGTPATCTNAALDIALTGGGAVSFNCGAAPVTITVATTKTIAANTSIDGGGLITLSGGGARRVLLVNSGTTLDLLNLTISDGTGGFSGGGGVRQPRDAPGRQ